MSEQSAVEVLGELFHDNVVVMQAAWIEWRYGRGAEVAMQWIENHLSGPGQLPDEDEPYADDAQRYYDLNKSRPWPECVICGKPTHIANGGNYFCSEGHRREFEEVS